MGILVAITNFVRVLRHCFTKSSSRLSSYNLCTWHAVRAGFYSITLQRLNMRGILHRKEGENQRWFVIHIHNELDLKLSRPRLFCRTSQLDDHFLLSPSCPHQRQQIGEAFCNDSEAGTVSANMLLYAQISYLAKLLSYVTEAALVSPDVWHADLSTPPLSRRPDLYRQKKEENLKFLSIDGLTRGSSTG